MYSKATSRDRQASSRFQAGPTTAVTPVPAPPLLDHKTLTPAERLDEVARLLALGILRLRARRRAENANDPNHLRAFGLDFPVEGSVGDTDPHDRRDPA